jgi:hypothetical protein
LIWLGKEYSKISDNLKNIMLQAGFLLGLFFNPEEGSNMFLQNVGSLSTEYMALYLRSRLPGPCQIPRYLKHPELSQVLINNQ